VFEEVGAAVLRYWLLECASVDDESEVEAPTRSVIAPEHVGEPVVEHADPIFPIDGEWRVVDLRSLSVGDLEAIEGRVVNRIRAVGEVLDDLLGRRFV